ncbi:MAG: DsbA family protein, partial [Proteobacteria bacterium]|nr:DsbA family protein [Pseudomonadota bacterium]
EIVKNTISDNPEIIVGAMIKYQEKKVQEDSKNAKKNLMALRSDSNTNDPRAGNKNGTIRVLEFFDYNCGHCREMLQSKDRILAENPDVLMIFKELPILGESSVLASKAAISVYLLDNSKYFDFQKILLNSTESYTRENLSSAAVKLGFDKAQFEKKMESPEVAKIIKDNRDLAVSIGVNGTPSYIVDGKLIVGAIGYDVMKNSIKAAREGLHKEKQQVSAQEEKQQGADQQKSEQQGASKVEQPQATSQKNEQQVPTTLKQKQTADKKQQPLQPVAKSLAEKQKMNS